MHAAWIKWSTCRDWFSYWRLLICRLLLHWAAKISLQSQLSELEKNLNCHSCTRTRLKGVVNEYFFCKFCCDANWRLIVLLRILKVRHAALADSRGLIVKHRRHLALFGFSICQFSISSETNCARTTGVMAYSNAQLVSVSWTEKEETETFVCRTIRNNYDNAWKTCNICLSLFVISEKCITRIF